MVEHWMVREWRKIAAAGKDPMTWFMLLVILVVAGIMLRFLLNAADNFGVYYSMPYACSERFSQLRLFFLSILAPLFFFSMVITLGELMVVLGVRRKKRKVGSYKFLFIALVSMLALGAVSFALLSC
ncbi:MAG: hypothetical protein AB1831_02210 [Pseudomonadota bacterium]